MSLTIRRFIKTVSLILLTAIPAAAEQSCEIPEQISTRVVYAEHCDKAVVTTNRFGRMQPLLIDLDSGKRSELPALPKDKDFFARDISRDCKKLALVSDNLGDGNFAVYLYDLPTKRLQKVSRAEYSDSGNPLFSPDGAYLSYTSGPRLIIYDPLKAEDVNYLNADAWIFNYIWAANSKEIYYRNSENALIRYVPAAKRTEDLYRFPSPSYASSTLSATKNKLYFSADFNSEFSSVYELDLRTKAVTKFDPPNVKNLLPGNADAGNKHPTIELLDISFKGDDSWFRHRTMHRYCAVVSEENPSLPCDGVVYSARPYKDKTLAVYSNAAHPISLYSFAEGEKLQELLGMKMPGNPPQIKPIKCSSEHASDFLFTSSADSDSLVIWLHGGPHEDVSPRYNPFIANIVGAGFDVLALNYPGSTGAGNTYALRGKNEEQMLALQVPQVEAAVDCFLSKHSEYKSLYLLGVSYGTGIMHRLLALSPKRYKAAIDFSGKTEIAPPDADVAQPLLLIYGDRDKLQQHPVRQAFLKKLGDRAATLVLPNEGHALRGKEGNRLACNAAVNFLRNHQ